jgi:hypothetical protein
MPSHHAGSASSASGAPAGAPGGGARAAGAAAVMAPGRSRAPPHATVGGARVALDRRAGRRHGRRGCGRFSGRRAQCRADRLPLPTTPPPWVAAAPPSTSSASMRPSTGCWTSWAASLCVGRLESRGRRGRRAGGGRASGWRLSPQPQAGHQRARVRRGGRARRRPPQPARRRRAAAADRGRRPPLPQAPKPSPGPHKSRECLPLVVMLRNRLK